MFDLPPKSGYSGQITARECGKERTVRLSFVKEGACRLALSLSA